MNGDKAGFGKEAVRTKKKSKKKIEGWGSEEKTTTYQNEGIIPVLENCGDFTPLAFLSFLLV